MFRKLWEWMKAVRRGERHIPDKATCGRIYEKRQRSGGGAHVSVNPKAMCEIKVIRANGTVEVHKRPVQLVKMEKV